MKQDLKHEYNDYLLKHSIAIYITLRMLINVREKKNHGTRALHKKMQINRTTIFNINATHFHFSSTRRRGS